MIDYQELSKFCQSARHIEVFTSLIKTASQSATARELKVSRQTINEIVNRVVQYAERRLYSPDFKLLQPVPPGFTGDYTLQTGPDGEIERMWTKGRVDKENAEVHYRNFIEGLTCEIKPADKTVAPKNLNKDLASAIIFGDAHLGMLAHAVETGQDDHNLEIATQDIRRAVDYLVDCAPASEEGWFINVGDFMHADSSKAQTYNETRLDVSARHSQVMRAAGTVIRYCISKMLTKFKRVTVINARGNHDLDAAFALNMVLEAVYENEPRVVVQGNDAKFNFLEFGKNLIGVNHGDGLNHARLAGIMTKDQAEAWGRTTFRRWWIGHIHHKQVIEMDAGVTIESFHTMAPTDAWHSSSGYQSERRVSMLTLHKQFGEVNRICPSLDMLRAQAT
jgi:hypothetical protein